MKPQNLKAQKILEDAGLKKTRSRLAIISVLLEAKRPVTREYIAQSLEDAPNKSTIYRNLDALVESDIVHKAFVHERIWHFELGHKCSQMQCHPHFTCSKCKMTTCLTEIDVPLTRNLPKGFILEHQRIQLEGVCSVCSSN